VIYGGGHERGMRSGTLNVPGIVGMGAALELGVKEMKAEAGRYHAWTQQIYQQLCDELGTENVVLNGHPTQRLPHNLNVSLKGIESKSLVVQLKDIAISTGSACTSATVEPSHVILALGFGEERAHNAIRVGVGRDNTDAAISTAITTLAAAVQRVRKLSATSLAGIAVGAR
jgi:cysteine desulfurase